MNIYTKITMIAVISIPLTIQAAYYRWTDEKGKTHYSNSIPPSETQLGYSELNHSGMLKKKVLSSQKNRELRLKEIQEAKQRKINEKKLKRKRIEEAEDSRLLYVFNNEAELTESYNAKLRLAQLTIDLLKSRHKVQSEKLSVLERRLERGTTVQQTEALEEQISNVIDNLKIYQQAITENIVEKDTLKKNYDITLKRYKRLIAALPKVEEEH